MIIHHPILGPRDSQEFVYLGDASLMNRPDGMTAGIEEFHDWLYTRDNPAGSIASFGITSRATGPGWSSRGTR